MLYVLPTQNKSCLVFLTPTPSNTLQIDPYTSNRPFTKKADDKIYVCKLKKNKSKLHVYNIENSKLEGKQCRSRWGGYYYEPPHQYLRCLKILLFSSLALKVLRVYVQ